MGRFLPLITAVVLACAGTVAIAAGSASGGSNTRAAPAAHANAEGNIVTGGLRFYPADLKVHVGESAAWTNTDFLVPHTVTETHSLWELSGTYGMTPANPPGFAPGTTVQRSFEAGTHHFICMVHGPIMSGSVAVPVDLASSRTKITSKPKPVRRRRGKRRPKPKPRVTIIATVRMRWAALPERPGLAFDVQRRRPGGAWEPVATATTDIGGEFKTTPGTTWEIQARLRRSDNASTATDWSPVASIAP
jgi:plastocyanin